MATKKQEIEESQQLKKKFEFSKLLVVFAVVILTALAIWSIIEYYILVRQAIELGNDILPDCTLPVTCVTTILGAILTYCLYQGALKTSLNKNKLTIDETTGIVRSIMDSELLDAIKDSVKEEEEE